MCFRIFQETLTNIVRHAKATRVDVRLAQVDHEMVLTVRDNGRGISEEEVVHARSIGIDRDARARGPGRRAGPLLRAARPGHHGHDAGADARGDRPGQGCRMRILIADDHAVVRQGLKQILAAAFKRSVFGEAANSQEALECVWKEPWDVVILDPHDARAQRP